MNRRYFTVGTAGHIDHGKTTLTKALTGVDTDRLKEEKERNISIEPGFAPLFREEDMMVSIVDVPGHERFIRQMIAGVAGIDLMLLVVAADEGVMPQTREHLDILSLLGIRDGIVVVTKADQAEEELLEMIEEDIRSELHGTSFEGVPVVFVDSISMRGIDELKQLIRAKLETVKPRDTSGPGRLPIDQVFTVKGHGTVVRGTVFEGTVREGQELLLLPQQQTVRVRQVQVHNQASPSASAGQRAALNITGADKELIQRGDVLTADKGFLATHTIDISLRLVERLEHPVKQRSIVKCHIGTAEVMGKLIFFDRNEAGGGGAELLCQLRLDSPVAARRGDRFVLRRPSPAETIGGGVVLDAQGSRYKFGESTVQLLQAKKEGTPLDRTKRVLKQEKLLGQEDMMRQASLSEQEWQDVSAFLLKVGSFYTLPEVTEQAAADLQAGLSEYHEAYPLRLGMNKAALFESLPAYPKRLLEYVFEQHGDRWRAVGASIALISFAPHFPGKWAKRMEQAVQVFEQDGLQTKPWKEYMKMAGIPEQEGQDLYYYLLQSGSLYQWEQGAVSARIVRDYAECLKKETGSSFTVQQAKEVLQLSRKLLILFLELLDELGYTARNENEREWRGAE